MTFQRSSGILLHPTSLPGPYGIGDLGPEAFRFVDFLAESGVRLWQTLPLGPTGYGDSPYQCFSAFAGNPYLVSPDFLLRDDYLHPNDLVEKPNFPTRKVDFGRIIPWKLNLLERAYLRFSSDPARDRGSFERFCADESHWLDDFALFMALKESNGGGAWDGWPASLRKREASALAQARADLSDSIQRFKFYQFLFFQQWNALRAQANSRGIKIVGDIPIFVAYDSADAWANPDLFFFDEDCRPTVVAGVPPDIFSPTGQLWGNPLYDWPKHKATGFAWWLARSKSWWKEVVGTVVALPLVLPPSVLGFYLLVAMGPNGPLGMLTQGLGWGLLSFSFWGLLIGSIIYSLPFVVQPLINAFETLGQRPLEAAATLRAGPLDAFWNVALPLARPGYLTGAVMGFAHTLGEFGVVLMIGGNIPGETKVLSIAIYDYVETLQWREAHVLAAGMLVFSFLVILAMTVIDRRMRRRLG